MSGIPITVLNGLHCSGKLYRILAPHFVAGIVVAQDGVIILTAPILKWAGNSAFAGFKSYCYRKGWKVEAVE
jgi:hypothetical protein